MEEIAERKKRREHIEFFNTKNEEFDSYYKKIAGNEDEWIKLYETLKEKLPSSFRLTEIKQLQQPALDIFRDKYFKNILGITELSWYPNKQAWQVNKSKRELKSDPIYSELRDFLVLETSLGVMSRQESVSMIPPLLLDIYSHHTILDMCASPGSKTAQLLERLLSSAPKNSIPEGFVVANDVNVMRCFTLITQLKRIPCPCLLVTCQDSRCYPSMEHTEIADDGSRIAKILKFDRILCDVPCTGDGTIRKNVTIYRRWKLSTAYDLHRMQKNILQRGVELLKVGGYLVYSTCSLNPIENEAVVYTILKQYKGALKCVDASEKLQGLIYLPGLRFWNFQDSNPEIYTKIKKCLDCPTEEEYYELGLNNCVRIHPHFQNTGGFFVALIQKTSELSTPKLDGLVKQKEPNPVSNGPNVKRKRLKHKVSGKEVINFMKNEDSEFNSLIDFYGLHNVNCENLAIRSEKASKNTVYYINNQMSDFINCNKDRLRIISCGSRFFSKSSFRPTPNSCDFRIVNDCLYLLKNLISKRFVIAVASDLIQLIKDPTVRIEDLTPDFVKQIDGFPQGSIIMIPSEDTNILSELCIVGHVGMKRVQLMVSLEDRCHLKAMYGICADKDLNVELIKSNQDS